LKSARDRLRDANPNIEVELHECRFSSENASELVARYDLVVDGSDNFPTRYLSNDVCVFARRPNIYGSIFRFDGQSTVFAPHLGGPCYRCLFPEPPAPGTIPNCAEAGVLGALPGIIGMVQAIEAIKLIFGVGEPLEFEIARIDGAKLIPLGQLANRLHELKQNGQTVVHCHTGMRSAQAVQMLRQSGFTNVYNLEGGIDAWANEIDPAVQKC